MCEWLDNQLIVRLDRFCGDLKCLRYEEEFLIRAYQRIFKALPVDSQQLLIRLTLKSHELDEQQEANWMYQWLTPEVQSRYYELRYALEDQQEIFEAPENPSVLMVCGLLIFQYIDKYEYNEKTFTLWLCKETLELLPEKDYLHSMLYHKVNESFKTQLNEELLNEHLEILPDEAGTYLFEVNQRKISSVFQNCQPTDVIRVYQQLVKCLPLNYRNLLISQLQQLQTKNAAEVNQQIFDLRNLYHREEALSLQTLITTQSIILPQTVDFLGLVCLGLNLFSYRDQLSEVNHYFKTVMAQTLAG